MKGDDYIEKTPNSTIWIYSHVNGILYCGNSLCDDI